MTKSHGDFSATSLAQGLEFSCIKDGKLKRILCSRVRAQRVVQCACGQQYLRRAGLASTGARPKVCRQNWRGPLQLLRNRKGGAGGVNSGGSTQHGLQTGPEGFEG